MMIVLSSLALAGVLWADSDEGFLGKSPDGSIVIKRRLIDNVSRGQYVDFIEGKTGAIVFSFRSQWRSTSVLWAESGGLLCINDQTATSGDALYIFKVGPGPRVTLLRYPNDQDFASDLSQLLSKQPDPGRFTFFGEKWMPGHQLSTQVTAGHYGSSHFDAVLQVEDDGSVDLVKPKLQIPGLISPH